MKKYIYILLLFCSFCGFAQVGINTLNPDSSSMLEVYSENMGISFPNVSLTGYTDTTTIPNPKESLIVYNTNNNLYGKKGYYYWNGSKWDYFIHEVNLENIKNHTRYSFNVINSTNKVTLNSNFPAGNNDVIGAALSGNNWTVLNDLTKNITIDRSNNQTLFTITGMAHLNNSVSGGLVSVVFGFFVDDKIVDLKPISIDINQSLCAYREFTIYAVTKNLTAGNHTIKFAVKSLSGLGTNGLNVTFGGRNPSSSSPNCNNLTDDEARLSSTVFVNQPYQF